MKNIFVLCVVTLFSLREASAQDDSIYTVSDSLVPAVAFYLTHFTIDSVAESEVPGNYLIGLYLDDMRTSERPDVKVSYREQGRKLESVVGLDPQEVKKLLDAIASILAEEYTQKAKENSEIFTV